MTEAQETALNLIKKMLEVEPKFKAVNAGLRELHGDFSPEFSVFPECIYHEVLTLIDAVLDDDEIASYFLCECQIMKDGGSVTELNGRNWPLKTIDDLRAYITRERAP